MSSEIPAAEFVAMQLNQHGGGPICQVMANGKFFGNLYRAPLSIHHMAKRDPTGIPFVGFTFAFADEITRDIDLPICDAASTIEALASVAIPPF